MALSERIEARTLSASRPISSSPPARISTSRFPLENSSIPRLISDRGFNSRWIITTTRPEIRIRVRAASATRTRIRPSRVAVTSDMGRVAITSH